MDGQGAWGAGACSTLPDEFACVGIIDAELGASLGPGMDGCRVEQGWGQHTLPVGEGSRTILPAGWEEPM